MIQFKHIEKSSAVIVNVETTLGFYLEARILRNQEIDAILLRNQLKLDLENRIEQIRRDAYNQGWKDKASKKVAKKKNFNKYIGSSSFVGY